MNAFTVKINKRFRLNPIDLQIQKVVHFSTNHRGHNFAISSMIAKFEKINTLPHPQV